MKNEIRILALLLAGIFLVACGDARKFEIAVVHPLLVAHSSLVGTASGSPRLARDGLIQMQFSDDIDPATLSGKDGVVLLHNSSPVPVTVAYDATTFTLTVQPQKPLGFSEIYTINLGKAIRRQADGAVLAKTISQSFSTEAPPQLRVLGESPADKAEEIGVFVDSQGGVDSLGSQVAVTATLVFSERVSSSTLNSSNLTVVRVTDGTLIPGTITVASSDKQFADRFGDAVSTEDIAIWQSDEPLRPGTQYRIQLQGGAGGLQSARATTEAGWLPTSSLSYVFKTRQLPPLVLLYSTPPAGAYAEGQVVYATVGGAVTNSVEAALYGNAVSLNLMLSFSESVDPASFADSVTVYEADVAGNPTSIKVPGSWIGSGGSDAASRTQTWTFAPTSPWQLAAHYVVVLDPALQSYRATLDAGQLQVPLMIPWTTANPQPLYLTLSDPSNGASNIGSLRYVAATSPVASQALGAYPATSFGNYASASLLLRFSESLDRASFASYIRLLPTDSSGTPTTTSSIPIILSLTGSGTVPWKSEDTVTIWPDYNQDGQPDFWPLSGHYLLQIDPGVSSYRAAGSLGSAVAGTLNAGMQVRFSIADPAPLAILTAMPGTDVTDLGLRMPDAFGNQVTFGVSVRFSERMSDATINRVRIYDVDSLNDLTASFTIALADSGSQPWGQKDILEITNNGSQVISALSKDYRLVLPADLSSYRGNATAGTLGLNGVSYQWDVADPLPLLLTATSPGAGASLPVSALNRWSNASYSSVSTGDGIGGLGIRLVFSEPVSRSTLAASFSMLENGVTPVPGTFVYSGGDATAVFTPLSTLRLSATYTVQVTGGSQATPFVGVASVRGSEIASWYNPANDYGGFLDGNRSWSFSTPDPDPLRLVSVSPTMDSSGYAANVTRGVEVVLDFSEPVSADVVNNSANYLSLVYDNGATSVVNSASFVWSNQNRTVTIRPTSLLDFNMLYRLQLLASLHSWRATSAGGALLPAAGLSYRFKTIDPSPVVLMATSPSGQDQTFGIGNTSSTGVNFTVQAVFQTLINAATVSAGSSTASASFALEQCTGPASTPCSSTSLIPGLDFATSTLGFVYDTAAKVSKLTFSPKDSGGSPFIFEYLTTYRATFLGGVQGIRNQDGGWMAATVSVQFQTRSRPNLEVRSFSPANAAASVPVKSQIVIAFSEPLSLPTIDASIAVRKVTDNTLFALCQYNVNCFYDSGAMALTITEATTTSLAIDTRYSVQVTSSLESTAGNRLSGLQSASWQTQIDSLIVNVSPGNGTVGVDANLAQPGYAGRDGKIVVEFSEPMSAVSLNATTVYVTHVDGWGRTVRLNAVTQVTNFGAQTGNLLEIFFLPQCGAGGFPLDYNHAYTLFLGQQIWNATGTRSLASNKTFTFTTGAPPAFGPVTAYNSVANVDVALSPEVMVNATFGLDFNETMDTASLYGGSNGTIHLTDLATGNRINVLVTQNSGTHLTFVPDPTDPDLWPFDSTRILYYGRTYELRFVSGPNGIRNLAGEGLGSDYAVTFTTSPANDLRVVPTADDLLSEDSNISLAGTRPLYAPSVNDKTILVTENGRANVGLVSVNSDSPNTAGFIIIPGWTEFSTIAITVTTGILDSYGNPLSQAIVIQPVNTVAKNNHNEIQLPSIWPSTAGNGVDTSPEAANGRQLFSFHFECPTNNIRERVLAPSISPKSVYLRECLGGGSACSTLGPRLSAAVSILHNEDSNKYGPGLERCNGLGTQRSDVALLRPTAYMLAGHTYRVDVQSAGMVSPASDGVDISSILRISTQNPPQCAAPECTPRFYVGESVPPTLLATSPSNGAAAVAVTQTISLPFDEGIRPESVTAGTTLIVEQNGVPIGFSYRITGENTITITADQPFTGGALVAVTATSGILDYAGNAFAGSTFSFTTENQAPYLITAASLPASGSTSVTSGSSIQLVFSEPIMAGGVIPDRFDAANILTAGTVSVIENYGSSNDRLAACVAVNGSTVTIDTGGMLVNTVYASRISSAITDLGGTPLDRYYPVATTWKTLP